MAAAWVFKREIRPKRTMPYRLDGYALVRDYPTGNVNVRQYRKFIRFSAVCLLLDSNQIS